MGSTDETTPAPAQTSIGDISPDWLSDVLCPEYPGVEVTSISADDPITGMSMLYRIHVGYRVDVGLPSTMIIKGYFGRGGADWNWMYETEMAAYRDFLPVTKAPAPHAYYAGHEPRTGAPIILLEDLSQKGVKFNDTRTSLTYREAAGFLDAFARYHARYWNSKELDPGGAFAWTVPLLSGFVSNQYFPHVTSPSSWEKYLNKPRGAIVPRVFRDANRMQQVLKNLAEFQKAAPWCIVHGDAHFGNSYMYPDGSPGLVDWQIKRGPWHQDVSYFLVSALDIEDRRNWDRSLIEYYLTRLAAHGATAPSMSEAFIAYRAEIMYGMVNFITNGSDQEAYIKEPLVCGTVMRFVVAAIDHDAINILI